MFMEQGGDGVLMSILNDDNPDERVFKLSIAIAWTLVDLNILDKNLLNPRLEVMKDLIQVRGAIREDKPAEIIRVEKKPPATDH